MFTKEEEQFLKDLYAHHKAKSDYEAKVEEYTLFRASLDDVDDPLINQKSAPYEDEILQLKATRDLKADVLGIENE